MPCTSTFAEIAKLLRSAPGDGDADAVSVALAGTPTYGGSSRCCFSWALERPRHDAAWAAPRPVLWWRLRCGTDCSGSDLPELSEARAAHEASPLRQARQ